MQSFLTFTLSTYLNEFEKKVTDSLIPESDMRKIYVEHKVDGLLRSDSAGRSAFYAQALGNTQQDGFMTVAEVRQKENLPHLDGTDELRTASEFATQGQSNAE
jgi:phage portal protein BeeE